MINPNNSGTPLNNLLLTFFKVLVPSIAFGVSAYLYNRPKNVKGFESILIHKVIDNTGKLIPANKKEEGCCFGITVTVLNSLFAGNLDEYKNAIELINQEFKGLNSELEIKQRISELEADKDKRQYLALIANIVIAQDANNYQGIYVERNPAFNNQHPSIQGLLDFFACGTPDSENKAKGKVLDGISSYCDHEKLKSFLNDISSTNEDLPIAFVLSYMGHTIGCGYDHVGKTWISTNIHRYKIIEQHITADSLADHVWSSLKRGNATHRYGCPHTLLEKALMCYLLST